MLYKEKNFHEMEYAHRRLHAPRLICTSKAAFFSEFFKLSAFSLDVYGLREVTVDSAREIHGDG